MPGNRIVMLIEDDPLLARAVVRMLFRLGFDVRAFESGGEALADLAAGTRPEAILLDLHLPGMCGRAVHGRIAESYPDLERAVIFMTGGSTGEPGLDLLLDEHRERTLPKPFTEGELVRLLEQARKRLCGPESETSPP